MSWFRKCRTTASGDDTPSYRDDVAAGEGIRIPSAPWIASRLDVISSTSELMCFVETCDNGLDPSAVAEAK